MPETNAWSIKRMLDWSQGFLSRYGSESPRLDAELLLGEVLGLRRMDLYVQYDRPIEATELAEYKALIKRRASHEPVAYILGSKGFHAIDLAVRPGVLVPRPETEHLVDVALAFFAEPDAPEGPIVDVGTGSGAVILALAHGLPEGHGRALWASDRSPVAAAQARDNASTLGVALSVQEGDLLAGAEGPFAAILSNPPYVCSGVIARLSPTVRDHEPHLALDGGTDGLDVLRRLVALVPEALVPGGLFAVELGSREQGERVAAWLTERGMIGAAYSAIGPGPTGLVTARRSGPPHS